MSGVTLPTGWRIQDTNNNGLDAADSVFNEYNIPVYKGCSGESKTVCQADYADFLKKLNLVRNGEDTVFRMGTVGHVETVTYFGGECTEYTDRYYDASGLGEVTETSSIYYLDFDSKDNYGIVKMSHCSYINGTRCYSKEYDPAITSLR
jgi:hypothetical protein